MSNPLTINAESTFGCDCKIWMRSACVGEPFYKEHEGKRYCVLHFPGKEKSADFKKALQRKLESKAFSFQGVWFPDELHLAEFHFDTNANFNDATFMAEADFRHVVFEQQVYFYRTTFMAKVSFRWAIFHGGAYFSYSEFAEPVSFARAKFKSKAFFIKTNLRAEASFWKVVFSEEAHFEGVRFLRTATFREAIFDAETSFQSAIFEDYVHFNGYESLRNDGSLFDFQFVKVEMRDHLSFHSLKLRPSYFVNVDAQRLNFTNVHWLWYDLDDEIESLSRRGVSEPSRMLPIVYRQLALNAEDNHRYEEASKFRYMAMDVGRRERWRGFAVWRLIWWYWLASGYGERATQAFLVLLGILLLSALLYTHVGFARWETRVASESDIATARRDEVGSPLPLPRALAYSAAVMTFQKPEPRPATTAAQTVVLLETILGPVQAALLALAIRRKFMR